MGRTVDQPTGTPEWYVVDIDDNREDPDPFRVLMSPLSGTELSQLELGMGAVTNLKPNFVQRAQEIVRKIFEKRVLEVVGYTLKTKTGAVVTPRSGKALFEAVLQAYAQEEAVINDIVGALKDRSKLQDGLWERLRSRSDSSTPAVPPGAGAASSAVAPTGVPMDSVSTTQLAELRATATTSETGT